MVLKKCPSCKNVVSMDSYCCPRCGTDFRSRRRRVVVFWLIFIAAAGWLAYRHFTH